MLDFCGFLFYVPIFPLSSIRSKNIDNLSNYVLSNSPYKSKIGASNDAVTKSETYKNETTFLLGL